MLTRQQRVYHWDRRASSISSDRLAEEDLPHLERALGVYRSMTGERLGRVRDAARAVPATLILSETDCPYLAPQPVRGKTNEPAYVVHTITALAEARGETSGELGRQIDANAAAAFGLP